MNRLQILILFGFVAADFPQAGKARLADLSLRRQRQTKRIHALGV
jgi:hypothetical protein